MRDVCCMVRRGAKVLNHAGKVCGITGKRPVVMVYSHYHYSFNLSSLKRCGSQIKPIPGMKLSQAAFVSADAAKERLQRGSKCARIQLRCSD